MRTLLKFIPLICLVLLFITCKKDNKQTNTNSDIVGSWALDSSGGTSQLGTTTYTSEQYPCIKANIYTINNDGTANLAYTGKDTCYIIKPTASDPHTFATEGTPGQSRNLTWMRTGNNFLFNPHDSNGAVVKIWGVINNSNGQSQLVLTDTITDAKQNKKTNINTT